MKQKRGFAPILILVITLLLGAVGIALYFLPIPFLIPPTVILKYNELDKKLPNPTTKGLGAHIEYCRNNLNSIYAVGLSGGFSGVTYYYNRIGTLIWEDSYTDTLDFEELKAKPKPPINIRDYTCDLIK